MKVVAGSSETIVNFSGLHDVTSQKTAVLLVTVKGTPKLSKQKTALLLWQPKLPVLVLVFDISFVWRFHLY